ncbi:MAG: hypothetical protein F6K02_10405 [Moorea sp. SIO3A5]|nr:hypothetical protein [Moorena sp. SIO3A5]
MRSVPHNCNKRYNRISLLLFPIPYGCISFLLFDPVVRYGVGYFKAGEELENQGDPTPNAPYAKFTVLYSLFPTPSVRFP